jgi:preprotein translocase subunit YajC
MKKLCMVLPLALILYFMVGYQNMEAMKAQTEAEAQKKKGEEVKSQWRDNPKLKGGV